MADERREEETEMASPEEMEEVLGEETPPRGVAVQRREPAAQEEWGEEEATPVPQTGLNVGRLADRLAGGFIDLLLLAYLYFAALFVFNYLVWREMLRPIPSGTYGLIFHGVYFLLFFLYFFIFEGVLFTTPGKMLCRLSVRDSLGRPASLLSIAVRNLIRPVDYLLCCFPTWILLEKFSRRQRLGDWLAGTVVMKHFGRPPTRQPVTGYTASATLRLLAGLVDFATAGLWIGGILLWVDPEKPLFSLAVIGSVPIFYLAWHLFWEGGLQTTFGFWLAGLKIVTEEGAPIGFTQAILRALFRLFDTNPIGWMLIYLSPKAQRPADLAAATAAVHAKRSWNGLIGMGVSLGLIGGVWMLGFQNPHSYLTPGFRLDFLPRIFSIREGGLKTVGGPAVTPGQGLFVKNFRFLEPDKKTPKAETVFKPGERVFLAFDLIGFTVRDQEAWVQEDITVRGPNQTLVRKQENIVEFRQTLEKPDEPVEFTNIFILQADAKPGFYNLVMVFRDRLGNKKLTEQRTFRVIP